MISFRKTISVLCMLIAAQCLLGQLPKTELYLFNFSNSGSTISLRNPTYLTGFNLEGYNNQPAFFSTNELYLTSNKYGEFTDIVKLDLRTNTLYRVTETDSISEFSPTLSPIEDRFSTVRIERDGSTQSLWLYPLNQENTGSRLLRSISTIGYHCWLSEDLIAMFLLPEPFTLYIGSLEENNYFPVIDNIGRCLRQNDNGNLVFVHKLDDAHWYIKTFDSETKSIDIITQTLEGAEDFIILPGGIFLMGKGSILYSYNPAVDETWKVVEDLADYNITNITRMAMSRNRLVIVNAP